MIDSFIDMLREWYKEKEIKRLSKIISQANPDFFYSAMLRTHNVAVDTIISKTLERASSFLVMRVNDCIIGQAEDIDKLLMDNDCVNMKLSFSNCLIASHVKAQFIKEGEELIPQNVSLDDWRKR